MTRSRTHKTDEDLLGLVRQLKAENRNLKKRIRQLEKQTNNFSDDTEEDEHKDIALEKCTECTDGELEHKLVFGRSWKQCNNCTFRTKAKIT